MGRSDKDLAVRVKLNETLLRDEVRLHELKLLGHILRRPQDHSGHIISFDRFLEPQMWGGGGVPVGEKAT